MSSGAHAPPAKPEGKAAWMAAKASWREYESKRAAAPGECDVRVGIAASFTPNNLAQFAGARLLVAGFKPEVIPGPYNQLFQVCLDPRSHFGERCDVIALLWRMEDLMGDDCLAFLNGDAGAVARAVDKAVALASAVSGLRSAFQGTILVGVPPFPACLPAGPLALDNPGSLGEFHRVVVGKFLQKLETVEGARALDMDAVQRQVGYAAAFDTRQWYLYRQPWTDAYLYELGDLIARMIRATRRSSKKCVVLDCDNTLWGGVIGEDGLDGIQIGDEFPGSAFRDFQKLLLYWRSQGVFLAIASKNNEADVWEVFDRHDAMALKREHLSAWQINWLPKAENIALIAKALNIGVDSLVYIDDSPMEVAYMQGAQPEVTSVLLPEDPADIVPTLQRLFLFDRLDVTQEDRERADMMRAERGREALGAKMSKDEFLRALGLRFELFRARPEDLGRITQLINKTNQFNLTTRRRTLDEVRALAGSPDHRIYGLRVADRFGEYGLTGVVVIEVSADRAVWTIDTLLLSCRVLGRGVEEALLSGLAADARAGGAAEFVASFIPSKKNVLAATFLPDHGFRAEGEIWRMPVCDAPSLPAFVERLDAGQGAAVEA